MPEGEEKSGAGQATADNNKDATALGAAGPPKRKTRELGYIDRDNIIEKEEKDHATRKDEVFGGGAGRQPTRADRLGRNERTGRAGLDFYRDRFDQFQNSYNRKKHGHLQNMAGNMMQDGANQRLNTKMREYIHEELQKNLLHDRSADNLKKNLDALNIPT